jgi:hypothetical protein
MAGGMITTRRNVLAGGAALIAAPAWANGGPGDFDFLDGEWVTRNRKLARRLAGSTDWIEFGGSLAQRRLMSGLANSADNLFDVAGAPYRGVSLRAYDAKAGVWRNWWVDARDPLKPLGAGVTGRFKDGVGTFLSDDTLDGRPIKVRVLWTRPTPTTARWEQAFSADGGATWEVNWTTDFARPKSPLPRPAASSDPDGLGAFDLRAGTWDVRHRRLKDRLAGSTEWVEFGGSQTWWAALNGAGNVDTNRFDMPGGAYEGATLRSYDPKTRQWAIWWLDGRSPEGPLDPALKGTFKDGVGTFLADDIFRGRPIKVRFIWSNITRDAARWEQAFSPDGGATWETNWITEFSRAKR